VLPRKASRGNFAIDRRALPEEGDHLDVSPRCRLPARSSRSLRTFSLARPMTAPPRPAQRRGIEPEGRWERRICRAPHRT